MVLSGKKGEIYNHQAYEQAKLLNHSGWDGELPRGITPMDIDMVIDNNGAMLFIELSATVDSFSKLSQGERWTYESAIGNTHVAVLAHHNVPADQEIDTVKDIKTYEIMVGDNGKYKTYRPKCSWKQFVRDVWWNDVNKVRRRALLKSFEEAMVDSGYAPDR